VRAHPHRRARCTRADSIDLARPCACSTCASVREVDHFVDQGTQVLKSGLQVPAHPSEGHS
jgi:hypothetical protein